MKTLRLSPNISCQYFSRAAFVGEALQDAPGNLRHSPVAPSVGDFLDSASELPHDSLDHQRRLRGDQPSFEPSADIAEHFLPGPFQVVGRLAIAQLGQFDDERVAPPSARRIRSRSARIG